MIDLHSHVLPGVDDGPPTLEASLELARAAALMGTTVLAATPHIAWDLPNDAATVARGVRQLQPALDEAGIPLRLVAGGEVVVTRAVEMSDAELTALHLGGGDWLLAECPLSAMAVGFHTLLHALQERGHRIVLAHPERCPVLQRDPALLRRLVDAGMLSSITAGSLRGDFGTTVRRFALDLLEHGLVHNLASDAHDAVRRPPGLSDALAAAEAELPGVADRAEWMTVDVPRAVLEGIPVPSPPGQPPQPRRRGLLRRASRSR